MRIKHSLQAAALIAAAVLLGLLTVQGTYALWNATVAVPPGTVGSASFDVKMTAAPNSANFTNMTMADGTTANLAIIPTGTLLPGGSAYGGVVLTNNSNAGGTFSTAITATKGTVTSTGDGSLAQNVTVNAKMGTQATDCSDTSGYAALGTSTLTAASVAKAASTVFCLQVTLNSNPPTSVKGQAVNIPLTITARQLCGVPGEC
ncbi:SipW-dependent-type signal peptide-containing protein [Pseudarthrobacter sulfonivorans]|uniref:SipW-dependent-type signal peptide-containing protein n=1 Tax=Pseudarthrobacter sulfonivorans TaxID=121292 RepID=UPI002106B526|nr:SipW-dependent-type signal peptide-containing protein [Pseudarthrobacter sulfonivorans]